jgi:predicted dehydrogenase
MKRLNWGMIGGGKGSQIGPAHRIAAGLDGYFSFTAGALDADPEAGKAFAVELGVADARTGSTW